MKRGESDDQMKAKRDEDRRRVRAVVNLRRFQDVLISYKDNSIAGEKI
jgi:hypothetical protein